MSDKELMLLMGKISNAARRIVGGRGINIRCQPCSVYELGERSSELRALIDEYDSEMVRRTLEKQDTKHESEGKR